MMRKWMLLFCCLFVCFSGLRADEKKVPLNEFVVHQVVEGMRQGKPSSFEDQLCTLLLELLREGYVWRKGKDAELRPLFVTAQGLIEEVMADMLRKGVVQSVCGSIHTPLPATPLCMEDHVSENLVDPSIAQDQRRLVTVTFRSQVMRNYLDQGGTLFVAYPHEGDKQRTLEQQLVYRNYLKKYPAGLKDLPLKKKLPPLLVGATYRIVRSPGDEVVFGIGASQANAPSDQVLWRLWLGNPRLHRSCAIRLQAIECLLGRPLISDY